MPRSIKPSRSPNLTCSGVRRFITSLPRPYHNMLSSVALAAAALATLSSPAYAAECITPSVRREWRQFSTEQKAEWISAVNVSDA